MKIFIKNLLLGVLAGAAIAFGGILNVIAKAYIPDPYGSIVGALLFPIGLTMVCYFGFNLFTGKIGYLFDNSKNYIPFLLTVYLGNFIGSFAIGLLSFIFSGSNINEKSNDFGRTLLSIYDSKTAAVQTLPGALKVFFGAMMCGVLVYTAVMSYKKFKKNTFKVLGIFISIFIFVYLGFDHCIANLFYFVGAKFGFAFKDGWTYLNIALATLGNSVGAILLNTLIKKAD